MHKLHVATVLKLNLPMNSYLRESLVFSLKVFLQSTFKAFGSFSCSDFTWNGIIIHCTSMSNISFTDIEIDFGHFEQVIGTVSGLYIMNGRHFCVKAIYSM